MSTLGEYIKEVSGDSSVQGVMDGLMKGGEGVPATEATDAYSKGLVAAATEMAEDEAAMKRDNALRMTQIPTLALANGAAMPQLAFGTGTTWFEGAASADEPAAGGAEAESPLQRCVRTALMSGYRHLDCAEMYGTEAKVGAALAAWLDYTRSSRDEVFVTSKIWRGVSDVGAACRASLQKLRLEHLDLYLLHAPVSFMCVPTRGCPRRLHSSLSLPLHLAGAGWSLRSARRRREPYGPRWRASSSRAWCARSASPTSAPPSSRRCWRTPRSSPR